MLSTINVDGNGAVAITRNILANTLHIDAGIEPPTMNALFSTTATINDSNAPGMENISAREQQDIGQQIENGSGNVSAFIGQDTRNIIGAKWLYGERLTAVNITMRYGCSVSVSVSAGVYPTQN